MKFNGIESLDHYQDATIFWSGLSDPPADLKKEAIIIDGKDYRETCFGMCVIFDAETQKFDFVVDMDRDKACNVYYIDNNGDKHWFACEIPEELAKRIFTECLQILDFKKDDFGYEIKEVIQFEDGSGFVLAENLNSERPFSTAHFTAADRGQRYYGERRYFLHRADAIEDFSEQTEHKKQFLSVKQSQPQTDERQKDGAGQAKSKPRHPKHKRR